MTDDILMILYFLRIDTGVVNVTGNLLILAEINEHLVRDFIVGKLGIRISRILYSMCQ